jgi:hypothetical protein
MEHAVDSAKHSGRPHGAGFSARRAPPELPPLHPMLQLQRDIGNQAVLSLLRSGAIQAKLSVGAVDDPLEHEADGVAEQVMRTPDPALAMTTAPPQISRKCAACEEEDAKTLRTKSARGSEAAGGEAPSIVHDVLAASGKPLHAPTRAYFESRFARDFSDVRIHSDARAAQSAQAVNALAYTLGNNIVFSAGRYAPESSAGERLLAHELAHVVQQSSPASAPARRSAGLASRVANLGGTAPLLQRACLSAAECAAPTTGEPEKMIEKGKEDEKKSQQENPNKPGNGRRAVRLEEFARVNGVSLAKVVGLFVNLDNPPGWGAVTGGCGRIPGVRISDDPNAWCTFVPEDLELGAGQFLDNPAAATINGWARELWRINTVETLTHEQQHAVFGQAPHPDPPSSSPSCGQNTVIAGTKGKTVRGYLSELSAIVSEFQIELNALRTSPNPGPVWDFSKTFFDSHVLNASENISGILHALRCNCNCVDVEFLVRDTFEFTTKGWSRANRVLFNSIMNRVYPAVGWPLHGDPFCIDACDKLFEECLKTGVSGGGMFVLPGVDPGLSCLGQRSSCWQACQTA